MSSQSTPTESTEVPFDSVLDGTPAEGGEVHDIEWTSNGTIELEYTPPERDNETALAACLTALENSGELSPSQAQAVDAYLEGLLQNTDVDLEAVEAGAASLLGRLAEEDSIKSADDGEYPAFEAPQPPR